MYRRFLSLILFFSCYAIKAQEGLSKTELLNLLKQSQDDTTLIDIYNELAWPIYSYDLPDSSIHFANKAIDIASEIEDTKRLSIAHRRIGITYINKGETKSALRHQEISYELAEKINYKKGMQLALNNIGVAYLNNELLNKALPYFLKSLKIAEQTKNVSSIGSLYYNCAQVYARIGEYKKSNEFLFKSKVFEEAKQDSDLIASIYSGLSTNYRNLKMLDSSRFFLGQADKFISAQSNSNTKFRHYLNQGLLFTHNGEHKRALDVFLKTRPYPPSASDEITLLINIAEEYDKLGEKESALNFFKQAYELSLKTSTYNNLSYLSLAMSRIYENRKDYSNFSRMIHAHLNYRDSNDKYVKVQQIQQQQLEFDYERKQIADSLRFEHKENLKNIELEVAAAKLTKEKYFRIMLVAILVAILIFSIFIFNRFLLTKRQKKIIERQKQIVELKNQEILDSINYARRLQSAILPQINDIKKELNLDIFYLPKDIIGGDFYFFEKHNGHTFFAVCDCTGHGIPGALMSVVCHQALQKSIKEFNLADPGSVLTKTRQIVIESLNATQQNIKDGMDCSLIVMNDTTKQIHWAGANNHIWIVNNNELKETKADKQPVAFYENSRDFTSHTLDIQSGSLLYLFTDGYGDQFGGLKGKKYKNKSLKEFLVSIAHESAEKQVELLQMNFIDWKKELDQVDDVAVTVIRF